MTQLQLGYVYTVSLQHVSEAETVAERAASGAGFTRLRQRVYTGSGESCMPASYMRHNFITLHINWQTSSSC